MPARVRFDNPTHDTPGMLRLRLDLDGNLFAFHAVPPRVSAADNGFEPFDAILFSMEQQGMARADLQEVLGVSRGRLSEVLSGKRGLSKAMIHRLVDQLGIPAEILIQPVR